MVLHEGLALLFFSLFFSPFFFSSFFFSFFFFFFLARFFFFFLNIHRSGVLTALAWLVPHETAAVSAQVLCTPYNHAPIYFMQSHIRKVYACLATRNYSVVILTKSGLPLLTAVRDFVCMHHLNPAYLQENYLDFV